MPTAGSNKENNDNNLAKPSLSLSLSLLPSRGILKNSIYDDNNTVTGVMNFANEDTTEVMKRRRVSFAQNATVWNAKERRQSKKPKLSFMLTPEKKTLQKTAPSTPKEEMPPIRQSPRLKKLREQRELSERTREENSKEHNKENERQLSDQDYEEKDMDLTDVPSAVGTHKLANDDILINLDSPVRPRQPSFSKVQNLYQATDVALLDAPFSPFSNPQDDNATMELTSVIGGIASKATNASRCVSRPSLAPDTSMDIIGVVGQIYDGGDQTMDIVRSVGAVNGPLHTATAASPERDQIMENTGALGRIYQASPEREQTMEFTGSLGTIVGDEQQMEMTKTHGTINGTNSQREMEGQTMEMTGTLGTIYGTYPRAQREIDEYDYAMEMTKPLGKIYGSDPRAQKETEDQTMEMTRPLGAIYSINTRNQKDMEDQTMEMTRPLGAIYHAQDKPAVHGYDAMELPKPLGRSYDSTISASPDRTMDLTKSIGKIQTARVDDDNDSDVSMEITQPVGENDFGSRKKKVSTKPNRPSNVFDDETMEFTVPEIPVLRIPNAEPRLGMKTPQKQMIGRALPPPSISSRVTRDSILSMSPRKVNRTPVKKTSAAFKSPTSLMSDFPIARLTPRNVMRQGRTPSRKSTPGDNERNVVLKEFLSMISIDFMNDFLSNTRGNSSFGIIHEPVEDPTLADYVIGFQKLPYFDMYKHGSNQLRENIEIESAFYSQWEEDTYRKTPLLFQEYLDASADTKKTMDSQFKSLKIYARAKAKGDWYHWRLQLTDGLFRALKDQRSKLEKDQKAINEKQATVTPYLEGLRQRKETLLQQLDDGRQRLASLKTYHKDEIIALHSKLAAHKIAIKEAKQLLESKKEEAKILEAGIEQKILKRSNLRSLVSEYENLLHDDRDSLSNSDLKKLESDSKWACLCTGVESLRVSQPEACRYVFLDDLQVTVDLKNHEIRCELLNKQSTFLQYFFKAIDYHESSWQKKLSLLHKRWYAVQRLKNQLDVLQLQFVSQQELVTNKLKISLDILLENAPKPTKLNVMFSFGTDFEVCDIACSMAYGDSQYAPSDGTVKMLRDGVEKDGLPGLARECQRILVTCD